MTGKPFEQVIIDTAPAPVVFLVIGIPGSGKSTVSAKVASHFELGAHIEADNLQSLITSGGRWPTPEPNPEADRQLLLRARNAALLARSFHSAGAVPVIDDVVVRRTHLKFYLEQLENLPLRLIVLAPEAKVASERIAQRDKKLADDWSFLDKAMRSELSGQGLWIDTSDQGPEETVQVILNTK